MKKAIVFSLTVMLIGLLGGYLIGLYTFSYYTDDMRALILEQVNTKEIFYLITTLQSGVYALVASFFGYLMATRLNLMHKLTFDKERLKRISIQVFLLGIFFFLDAPVFGHFIPEVALEYQKGISPSYFAASLIYGGIIEEILLRLFFMTLIAFIISLIQRKKIVSNKALMIANIVAAFVFAIGHIPTTISLFGHLNFLILFRCFLLNGLFGFVFGTYYIKYGIQYAMLGHMGVHLVSKILLMIFYTI